MRTARILLPLLAALTVAACARHQQNYYVMDPATGQPVPVVQQSGGSHYAQAPYGQQGDARQAYAAPQSYAAPQPQQNSDRGLFNNSSHGIFARRNSAPAYPQAYAQQPYPQQPYAQQPAPRQSDVQQRTYGRYGYVMQYRPPQAAASGAGAYAAASYGYAYAPAAQAYSLDSGDRLRVVVFGQEGITGTYMVDASGHVSLPLIGSVPARGFTTQQLASTIADRLKQGYVREPHVTVEIAAYRPFFILGEVTNPGQYPFVANMTAENAIAIAGGFAPRADKRKIELTRNTADQRFKGDVPLNYPLRPGDTVVVKERWF
jgi:polysaccharide export outer membrane protein